MPNEIQSKSKDEDIFYAAMLARDPRFDGKFFTGVKTTRIYCRPICPAKPKRENVEFFRNMLEAEAAGYRPCMRCRPEAAPQSPVWIGKSAVVQRAVKTLNSLETLEFDEDQFAARFGVTARHLRRLFTEEIGKTPKQLSFEVRLNLARKLISETPLPITEVAFAAGFSSIRRFNDAFKDRFKKSPRELRRHHLNEDSPYAGIQIDLPYRPPFDFEGLLRSYQNHRMGDLEWFETGKMHRVVSFQGKSGKITVSNEPQKTSLKVEIDFPDTSQIHKIITRIRNMFDLDSDPVIIANALDTNSDIKALLKIHPGIRLPSGWDPFEVAISAILGQLVSVERSRALVHDLIQLAGSGSGLAQIKLFPTPKQILQADLTSLKTTRARKETLKAFSQAVYEGTLSLESTQDIAAFFKNILMIKGIGPWTAHYIALKAIRHTDAFPASDLVLARALEKHPQKIIETIRPWRGYVAALLWRVYAESLKKTGAKKFKKKTQKSKREIKWHKFSSS